ncbi:hypothetical protein BB559_002254 [Furculomyces boomerangus]|uniref:Essential protein Yae1 N-terminal domain-containing protein n=2 Tax=Harpellales TaxID=61421 RepID=A0A2T9YWT5_9FUNG|nr:hypothetical protein BB559_002254 [Furculomyces boomerangus]PVZ98119.1 hypothetical protein BB558_005887 [Smittium angustum]
MDFENIESISFHTGYENGIADGRIKGKEEGFSMGLEIGSEYGILLGKYRAWAEEWLSFYKNDNNPHAIR